jgi:hypothetical protein
MHVAQTQALPPLDPRRRAFGGLMNRIHAFRPLGRPGIPQPRQPCIFRLGTGTTHGRGRRVYAASSQSAPPWPPPTQRETSARRALRR